MLACCLYPELMEVASFPTDVVARAKHLLSGKMLRFSRFLCSFYCELLIKMVELVIVHFHGEIVYYCVFRQLAGCAGQSMGSYTDSAGIELVCDSLGSFKLILMINALIPSLFYQSPFFIAYPQHISPF